MVGLAVAGLTDVTKSPYSLVNISYPVVYVDLPVEFYRVKGLKFQLIYDGEYTHAGNFPRSLTGS